MSTVNKITNSVQSKFHRYLKNTAGSIAPIFGVMAVPMTMAVYASVEMASIASERTAFHAAADGAVLAVASNELSATAGLSASALEQRKVQLEQLAMVYINANYDKPEGASIDVEVVPTGEAVKISANLDLDTSLTSFGDLAGFDIGGISVETEVKKAMRPIELVMVMDTTGSMGSGGKLAGAKDAARQLLNTLYDGSASASPRSEFIRTSLVPFSGAVRLDTAHSDFNLDWIDTTGANPLSKLNFNDASAPAAWNNYYAWSRVKKSASVNHAWNGCVEARGRGTAGSGIANGTDYSANDVAPTSSSPETLFPAYFAPDVAGTQNSSTASNYGYNYIAWSGSPEERTGLSSSVSNSYTTTNLRIKQENYRKYDGRNIGAESTSTRGPWSGCAATKLIPMTYDRAKVETGITAMTAYGPTLIAEGLAWGMRAISPTEPLTKVEGSGSIAATTLAPFGDAKWEKVMVLMTDGDNDLSAGAYGYNNTTYSAYGFGSEDGANNRFGTTNSSSIMAALDTEMLNICSKIKAAGVELYVSSFGSGVSNTTKNRLTSCATSPTHYKHAAATSDLVSFFDHIGENVKNKSIYVSK